MTQFSIETLVCGNPDYGQDPNHPPYGVEIETLRSDTYEGILELVREWQRDNDIGGGNWMNPPLVRDGEVLGYMSYNGKVWSDKSWTPSTQQIYINAEVV